MSYKGPERRKYRVFITENTEYHMREQTCVAVRDNKSRQWLNEHQAVGSKVIGGVLVASSGSWKVNFGAADIGERICFASDLLTTPVRDISRPGVNTVENYSSSGEKIMGKFDALKELAEEVIEASLYWTGKDEEKNPKLKLIRTLAGLALQRD